MKAFLVMVVVAMAAVGAKGQCNSCACRYAHNQCSAPHQYCDESSGTPYCFCERGWSGNNCETSTQAVVNDPCSPNPCQNNGYCQQYNGGTICTCQTGWTGVFCANYAVRDSKPGSVKEAAATNAQACDTATCPQGKSCVNLQTGYMCQ